MSKVILCTGKRAEIPYDFKDSGAKAYTIEELCYCLKARLDVLDENMVGHDMARFIANELGMTRRGDLLDQLVRTKADLKSRLAVVFASCDYYDESEIKRICDELERLMAMPEVGRLKLKADKYMSCGQISSAVREYKNILMSPQAGQLSPSEYGAVLHNLAVVDARNGLFAEAADMFREAYERNGEEESLKAYLFALRLDKRENEYMNEAMRLLDNGNLIDRLELELEHLSQNLMQSGQMDNINRLKLLQEQGRVSEYNRLSAEIIGGLKRSYRLAGMD